MTQTSKYTITKATDLIAHICSIAERMPNPDGEPQGTSSLRGVLADLQTKIEGETDAATITITAFRWTDSSEGCFITVHRHNNIGEAIGHAYDASVGGPNICESDSIELLDAFVLSGNGSKSCTPEEAVGLMRSVSQLIADTWGLEDVQTVLREVCTRLQNAEDASHLFVAVGARKSQDGIEFANPCFTSSKSEAEEYVKSLKQMGYLSASLATFRTKCPSE